MRLSFFEIQGSTPLSGQVRIHGSKNAVLPMMAATILHRGTTILTNVPRILDVFWMIGILKTLGCQVWFEEDVLTIDASVVTSTIIPQYLAEKMRSSIIFLGPLLGRCNKASLWYPGGCSIGSRPIDLHAEVLRAMGARIQEDGEHLDVTAETLSGCTFSFRFASVGATENAIMCAVNANGKTVLNNVAREPEIRDLCRMLVKMGAKIDGIGSSKLVIEGNSQLHNSSFRVPPDRIVAATYLSAVTVCGGRIQLCEVPVYDLRAVLAVLQKCGCRFRKRKSGLDVWCYQRPWAVPYTKTQVYPGFPTDVQSLLMTVLSKAEGVSVIEETIFEARFHTALQLQRMGADIQINHSYAQIRGVVSLHGADVTAMDLRGGAALTIAGVSAEGKTIVRAVEHVFRGYESLERDLAAMGANIVLKQ